MSTESKAPEAQASTYPDFTKYKTISFDMYGTLIDWELGLSQVLRLIIQDATTTPKPTLETLLAAYCALEHKYETENPTMKYRNIVAKCYQTLCADHGITLDDQSSLAYALYIPRWPLFPDTYAALARLRDMGYKLVVLSNVDNITISQTIGHNFDRTPFAAIFTAENIGSYKPNPANFEFLIRHAPGLTPEDDPSALSERKKTLLHVAQSRLHDHATAKAVGIDSVWINRPAAIMGTEKGDDEAKYGYLSEFPDLTSFVDEVERQKTAAGYARTLTPAEKQHVELLEAQAHVPKYEINISAEDIERAIAAQNADEKKGWQEVGTYQVEKARKKFEYDVATGQTVLVHDPAGCEDGQESSDEDIEEVPRIEEWKETDENKEGEKKEGETKV